MSVFSLLAWLVVSISYFFKTFVSRPTLFCLGMYVEVFPINELTLVSQARQQYEALLSSLLSTDSGPESSISQLYVSSNCRGSARYSGILSGLNAKVRFDLSKKAWGVPHFRPTIKCHKDPRQLRPVICKRGTPSICVGEVIEGVFKKIG